MRLVLPYAGTAAEAVWACAQEAQRVNGRRYRSQPAISRTGCKAGFYPSIPKAWGFLHARWTDIWINDLDMLCHAMSFLLASSELRDAVARRIWGWVPCPECLPALVTEALEGRMRPTPDGLTGSDGCEECSGTGTRDARRLWEHLRKSPIPSDVVEALAGGVFMQARNFSQKAVEAADVWSSHGYCPEFRTDGFGTKDDPASCVPRWQLASRLESLPCGMARLADVIAAGVFLQSRSFQLKPVTIEREAWEESGYGPECDGWHGINKSSAVAWTVAERLDAMPPGRWSCRGAGGMSMDAAQGGHVPLERAQLVTRLESLPGPGNVSLRLTRQDAALCLPEGDCSDVVCILDPNYQGTTGYAHSSPRADVLMLARAWRDAGAIVLVHEACGPASELGPGWIERPASVLRGRSSTFWSSGEEREWISASRPPVWWPAQQADLFARVA